MQIFFYHLGRMKVIADILVFGIFFKGVFPFDCIEILLLGLKHTVQIDQALFLLFQFHFLHQADACTASFKRFGIEHLDAVNQNLRFIVVYSIGMQGVLLFSYLLFLELESTKIEIISLSLQHFNVQMC